MQEGDSFGNNSGLQFGILKERAALPPGERSNSPFGVITTQRLALDGRSMHIMHRCGIRWQRHHGLQFEDWTNRNGSPPDLDNDGQVENWRRLQGEGFLIQAQQFSEPPPDWAADTSIYHREGKQVQKDKPAIKPNTIGRYTGHVGEGLIEFTHFKLMNERDRDGRDQ